MRPLRSHVSVMHLAVYLVALIVGRMDDNGLAFFWPAAGVAALWMLRGRTRSQVVLDGTLLVAGTTVLDLVLGIDPVASVLFAAANLVVGVTVRLTSALLEKKSFWGRVPRRVATPRDLVGVGLASLAAALTSAVPGLLAVRVESGSVNWGTAAAWVVRNDCSTFVVVASVLAMLTTLFRAHAKHGWRATLTPEPRRFWAVELVWVVAISLGTAVFLFDSEEALPIAFILLVASTWIGYRFSPAVGGIYTTVFATLALLYTEQGLGPFSPIADLTTRAIVTHVYVLLMAVTVLMLSLGAYERAALHARVVESEERATSRAELLDAVMNAMTDGLVVVEASGAVMMSNQAADALAGNPRAPGQAGSPEDHGLSHPDGTPMELDEIPHVRALRGEVVPPEDVLRIDPDTGHEAILSIAAVPLPRSKSAGGPLAVLLVHDVTLERAHRRELQAFAGTVAHDLKAPLTGVGSWAEILGDQLDVLGVDVTEPRASLRRIETSAARMDQLISDLLSYSQAQSATLAPVPLSLTGMVEAVARELRDVHAGAPPLIDFNPLGRVLADRTLVGQLLTNVIGNAVKYVAPGTTPHVLIGSEVVGDMLEIRVADNGIGIPRAERGRIFDSFYRASSSGSYPGTGLGLAICARVVERHGGRISAREGLDGGGTTLVFTLPVDDDPLVVPTQDEIDADQRAGVTTSAEPPPRRVGSATAVS